jgi:flagellar assembly factor FliW
MAVAQTQRFGAIEYDPSAVLQFPAGLPGFEGQTLFAVVERPEWAPIVFLQSLMAPELCFMATSINAIDPDYALALTREDLDRLALDPAPQETSFSGLLTLALLSAPENGQLTANLLAPVVINPRTRTAVQAVRTDRRYSHQHPIPSGPQKGDGPC